MLDGRTFLLSTTLAASTAHAADSVWIDAHTHVFVRGLKPAVDARYAPNYDASWQTLLALAEKNGVGRAGILQPSFLGYANSALFNALSPHPPPLPPAPRLPPPADTPPPPSPHIPPLPPTPP